MISLFNYKPFKFNYNFYTIFRLNLFDGDFSPSPPPPQAFDYQFPSIEFQQQVLSSRKLPKLKLLMTTKIQLKKKKKNLKSRNSKLDTCKLSPHPFSGSSLSYVHAKNFVRVCFFDTLPGRVFAIRIVQTVNNSVEVTPKIHYAAAFIGEKWRSMGSCSANKSSTYMNIT